MNKKNDNTMVKNASFLYDLKLIFKTFKVIISE